MKRRRFLKTGLAAGASAALVPGTLAAAPLTNAGTASAPPASFRHSASKWCYPDFSAGELAAAGKAFGLASVELLDPEDWPAVKEHGLTCAMVNAPAPEAGWSVIAKGWNDPHYHDALIPAYEKRLREVAEAELPNLICFSGNRGGISDEEGLKHCAEGLRQITPLAEELGVTLCMELLNSKVDHPGYQCDRTEWGAELVERLGSERFRLLYDIYHMQIMEGDVIRTIREHHADHIAHYHTGGVPGRHEIDDTQELYYPAVMRAIAETGFSGFVGQEFIPAGEDPLASLQDAIRICSV